MQLNYLLQRVHTPTVRIRLYELDIQDVYTKYGLDTGDQQFEETSVLALDYCTFYELQTRFA
jgi:hypothetical protein